MAVGLVIRVGAGLGRERGFCTQYSKYKVAIILLCPWTLCIIDLTYYYIVHWKRLMV